MWPIYFASPPVADNDRAVARRGLVKWRAGESVTLRSGCRHGAHGYLRARSAAVAAFAFRVARVAAPSERTAE